MTKMSSILIEAGFLSNTKEAEKVRNQQHQSKISSAMSQTIDTWIRDI